MKLLVLALLLSAVNSARILSIFPFPSISHQFVFRSIVQELALRGHEVTFVTPNPMKDEELKNITQIDVSVAYKMFEEFDLKNAFNLTCIINWITNSNGFWRQFMSMGMDEEGMQDILRKPENSYDLILVETSNPLFFGFQHKFKVPMIAVCSCALITPIHEIMGNPVHPVLYPDILLGYSIPLTDLSAKIKSVSVYYLFMPVINFFVSYQMDKMARSYFGEDMPYITDIFKNISLVFGNVNPILSYRRPLVPNVKEVWNIHLKTPETLPSVLLKILDEAENGVIYLSLGTNVRFEYVEENLKEDILKALGELPYTVLCKWEKEDFPGKPKNVILRKWLPQPSILAHPNVKVFVTQGGLQSSEEAIINGVPLVIIPFMGDQYWNAKMLTSRGMAETVLPESVTRELLRDTIMKVANDEKYRMKAQELRSIFLDQPRTGLQEIVWWCEYVIRHKGAQHLRSPSADISFYEFYMLDVLAVILITLFLTYVVLRKIVRILIRMLRGNKSEKQKKS
ncbi:hypothetical protein HHI36_002714 [Cryptolaemus montrouzieri]|uniref:UDP-glucuronosyltransferase n=1 Tax=Cryptolaemus montrouzieri TaxID=559131 RepID=A0ABD2PBW1_9CUCU